MMTLNSKFTFRGKGVLFFTLHYCENVHAIANSRLGWDDPRFSTPPAFGTPPPPSLCRVWYSSPSVRGESWFRNIHQAVSLILCCILLNNSFNISFSWSSARYCTRVSCIKNFIWVHRHNLYFYRQYRVLNALLIAMPGASCSLRRYYTPSSLNLHHTMELAWLTSWACRGNRWAKLMPRYVGSQSRGGWTGHPFASVALHF